VKILYLTDPYPDYLADQIYTGLCKVLGWKYVVDFPFKAIYHDPEKMVWYLPQVPGENYLEEDIVGLLREKYFDFICISSPRQGQLGVLKLLSSKLKLPPIVIIDGEDDACIRYEIAEAYCVRLYFKREYIWANGRKVRRLRDFYNYVRSFRYNKELFRITHPLPFSAILESIPRAEKVQKDTDVSFRGFVWSKGSRKRARTFQILQQLKSVRFSGGIYTPKDMSCRMAPGEYYLEIQRSKLAVSIRGGGFDTLRFWEIPACKTLLLSERPDICIPAPFEHGRHAVFCKSDLSDLDSLVLYYLENENEREIIAERGYQHLIKFHTCEKRAEYFLDLCKKDL
jgi:hypothetical protein